FKAGVPPGVLSRAMSSEGVSGLAGTDIDSVGAVAGGVAAGGAAVAPEPAHPGRRRKYPTRPSRSERLERKPVFVSWLVTARGYRDGVRRTKKKPGGEAIASPPRRRLESRS